VQRTDNRDSWRICCSKGNARMWHWAARNDFRKGRISGLSFAHPACGSSRNPALRII
jgi:hypothetical protein